MRFCLFALLLLTSCAPLNAQRPRFVVFDPGVRDRLAEEWHEGNRYQHERGYCLRARVSPGTTYDIWRVHHIERAIEVRATTRSLLPVCDDLTDAILHTHPPAFCVDEGGNECYAGGDYAHQCQPSPRDVDFLKRSRRTFDVVQCGRDQLVPVFRDGAGFY